MPLGDRPDHRSGHRQQDGKFSKGRLGINRIAESYIHLHGNSCSGESGAKLHANSIVLIVFLNPDAFDRLAIE